MEVQGQGWWARFWEAARCSGPGWLLSAYTLGAGSAVSSLWAGSKYGYDLLWVQPVAMLMGVVILSGAAFVSLHNEERPYRLFWRLSPALALAWGLASLLASVIWHFPQYGLAYEALQELLGFQETRLSQTIVALAILSLATALTWGYATGFRGLVVYESIMKLLVWMIVLCLAVVVLAVPVDWGAVLRGLLTFRQPEGTTELVFAMLSAAVGINMTFLYPYSVRAKGWSPQETHLAVRDLIKGMFLPFVVATGLLIVASAATLHAQGVELDRSRITEMAGIFEPVFGSRLGPALFNLGILAMPLSSITLHMLTCGFILSEMAGQPLYGKVWKVGSLCPAVGALGVAFQLKGWLPVSASALCLIFLPIAYLGFMVLFLQELRQEEPQQARRWRWLLGPMGVVILVVAISAALKAKDAVEQLGKLLAGG